MKPMFKSNFIFYYPKTNAMLLVALALSLFICSSCGTTKTFNIQSNPEGALIMKHNNIKLYDSDSIKYCGKAPIEKKITFMDDEKYYFTGEKRGYSASTQAVTKDSDTNVFLNLERIEGVPEEVFDKEKLKSGLYYLLPVNIEVFIRSGLGDIAETNRSEELSQQISQNFQNQFMEAFGNSNREIKTLSIPKEEWERLSKAIDDFVLTINPNRLDSYSTPSCISANIDHFNDITDNIENGFSTYLIYVWGKCISETKGRKIGNFLLARLGHAVDSTCAGIAKSQGNSWVSTINYEAFEPDKGLIFLLYVIDANTSEVVYIKELQTPHIDIMGSKSLNSVTNFLSEIPK